MKLLERSEQFIRLWVQNHKQGIIWFLFALLDEPDIERILSLYVHRKVDSILKFHDLIEEEDIDYL